MHPNLCEGHIVFATKLVKPKAGRVIIFRHDGLEKIKRVKFVESEGLYVVGDNLPQSQDSRRFGLIKKDSVVGTVMFSNKMMYNIHHKSKHNH